MPKGPDERDVNGEVKCWMDVEVDILLRRSGCGNRPSKRCRRVINGRKWAERERSYPNGEPEAGRGCCIPVSFNMGLMDYEIPNLYIQARAWRRGKECEIRR